MARDDSALYTGMTSTTSRRVAKKQELEGSKRKQEKNKVATVADRINEITDKELESVTEKLLNLIDDGTTEEQANSLLIAFRLYRGYLKGHKSQIQKIVRTQLREVPDGEK